MMDSNGSCRESGEEGGGLGEAAIGEDLVCKACGIDYSQYEPEHRTDVEVGGPCPDQDCPSKWEWVGKPHPTYGDHL